MVLFASSETHLWFNFFKIHYSKRKFWKFVIVNALKSTWLQSCFVNPSRTCCVISVVWVVKRSNRGLDTLVNKGEINTEEANFKRHKVSTDRYFHLPNLVGQKDFHLPKRNFHLPNGSLVGAFRHPVNGSQFRNFEIRIVKSEIKSGI